MSQTLVIHGVDASHLNLGKVYTANDLTELPYTKKIDDGMYIQYQNMNSSLTINLETKASSVLIYDVSSIVGHKIITYSDRLVTPFYYSTTYAYYRMAFTDDILPPATINNLIAQQPIATPIQFIPGTAENTNDAKSLIYRILTVPTGSKYLFISGAKVNSVNTRVYIIPSET